MFLSNLHRICNYLLELGMRPFLPTAERIGEREPSYKRTTLKCIYKEIWTGSFPALVAGPVKDRDLFYSSYLQTYLQRDIRDLAQIGSEATFLRFLKACAARTAQMLNLSDLARDADVSVNTAKNWLSVLQASFQIQLLQPYHSNMTKRLVKRPKLYFLDTGLCAYLTEWSSPETLEAGAMSGPIFETHAYVEVLKSWWQCGKFPQVYYYRNKDGKEIDLLFAADETLYPVEIKKSAAASREWSKMFGTLGSLKERVGEQAVVCLCEQPLPLSDRVSAVPVGLL